MKNCKKLMAVLLSVVMIFTTVPAISLSSFAQSTANSSTDATEKTGIFVSAQRLKIDITVNKVGTSGRATLYRFNANEYYSTDKIGGLNTGKKYSGTKIGTYTCGTANKVFTIDRYTKSGNDLLYSKYYLIQNGKVLCGPVYATDIYAQKASVMFDSDTKKGLLTETPDSYKYVKDVGAGYTVINVNIPDVIRANEDKNGKPIDRSNDSSLIPFVSGGKTYYFVKSRVQSYDNMISRYSKAGINVSLIVNSFRTTDFDNFPYSMCYGVLSGSIYGINTSTELGRNYWIAFMEFFASRYSRSADNGYVHNYVIGNEIDLAYNYFRISKNKTDPIDRFMEEYSRALRLANLAVKKYAGDATVTIPLAHYWSQSSYDLEMDSYRDVRIYSYAPKDMLEWLNKYTKLRGDYDWGIAPHCYGVNLPQSEVGHFDTQEGKISGDYNTSKFITILNLEVLDLFLKQDSMKYNNQLRSVWLTESGVSSMLAEENNNARGDYDRQSAYIAQFYYRAAHLDSVKALIYYRLRDHEEEVVSQASFGILDTNGRKKPAYNVYKYIDTEKSFEYSNKYLSSIKYYKNGKTYSVGNNNVSSYLDVMTVTDSDFNWKTNWDENKIICRRSNDDTEETIKTDKAVYKAGEPIYVTATGSPSDWVGLYKKSDKAGSTKGCAESIYWYYVGKTNDNKRHISGRTYDIRTYGEVNASRYNDASLPAGDYKVVLFSDNYSVLEEVEFKITGTVNYNNTDMSLNKTQFNVGEDIIVTATGSNKKLWVGLYGKDDKYGEGEGTSTATYWYYVNDSKEKHTIGVPTILQSTTFQSTQTSQTSLLPAGDYTVYLFEEKGSDSYNELKKQDIVIKESVPKDLVSVDYRLENETDGFANGKVVVNSSPDEELYTDCVLYWADADGMPLEGYASLAKFKITGLRTEFDMYSNTVIPNGAKKLIAYASNGNKHSANPVSVDLPENCTYDLSAGEVLSEFQVISDVHVTKPDEAVNEVKYSNEHFRQMLKDVANNSKNSAGIFINGDIANSGRKEEFNQALKMYINAGGVPNIHMSIGNHDWIQNNPNNQFQKYVHQFNNSVTTDKIYYDEWVNGYHYIYLGGEKPGLHADMSAEQLAWFDELMKKDTASDPDKPVFVFLHQSMKNTVAGSFDGQGWDGVENENAFKKILKKYGQIVLFNGHSHWELDSIGCMYNGSSDIPVAFNTGSVGYLWSSYNIDGGEYYEGSHGYYVRVYKDKIIVLGRDFVNGLFMPSAVFVINRSDITAKSDAITKTVDSEVFNVDISAPSGRNITYISADPTIACVDSLGNVTTKKAGTTYIVATVEGSDTQVMAKKSVKLTVNPSSLTKVSGYKLAGRNSKAIAVKWSKASGISGYDVYNSTTKKHYYTTATSYKISGLKPGKANNIYIRKYKDISGERFYGPWSSVLKTSTRPVDASVKAVSSKSSGKLNVSWKKTKGSTGYQIQVSTSKKFTKSTRKTVNVSASKTSYTFSKLKKGKKFYVRIRSFAKNSNGTTYGYWSKAKTKKVIK